MQARARAPTHVGGRFGPIEYFSGGSATRPRTYDRRLVYSDGATGQTSGAAANIVRADLGPPSAATP